MTRENNPEAMETIDQRDKQSISFSKHTDPSPGSSDNDNGPQHEREAQNPVSSSGITKKPGVRPVTKSEKPRGTRWSKKEIDKLMPKRAENKHASWDEIKELTGSERSAAALAMKHLRTEEERSQAAREARSEGAGTITRHLDLPPLTTKPESTLAQDTTDAKDQAQAPSENARVLEENVHPDSLAEDYLIAMDETSFEAAKEVLQALNRKSPNSALTATSNIVFEQIRKLVDLADDLTTITRQQQEEMHSRYHVANAVMQHLGVVLGLDHLSTPSRQERISLITQQPLGPNFEFLCDVPDCNSKTGRKSSFVDHMRKKHSAPDATTGVGRTGFEITDCDNPRRTWDAKLKTDPEGTVRWTGHFWDVALGRVATADSVEDGESEDTTVERKGGVESGRESVRSGVH